jgi:hypothetical protein
MLLLLCVFSPIFSLCYNSGVHIIISLAEHCVARASEIQGHWRLTCSLSTPATA